jgi:hypothetical protein
MSNGVITPAAIPGVGTVVPSGSLITPSGPVGPVGPTGTGISGNTGNLLKLGTDSLPFLPITAIPLRGYIANFTLSYNTTTLLSIAAGMACDNAIATIIVNNSATFTKSISGAWVAGSGNGGMGTGLTATANTWYHVFAIINGGAFDVYFDTSVIGANMPSGTTALRRIGSIKLNASSQIMNFTQWGDDFLWVPPAGPVVEQTNFNMPGATNTVLTLIGVPSGVKVRATVQFYCNIAAGNGTTQILLTSPDTGVQVVDQPGTINRTVNFGGIAAGSYIDFLLTVRTNTAAQLNLVASANAGSSSTYITTIGWMDDRGKNN